MADAVFPIYAKYWPDAAKDRLLLITKIEEMLLAAREVATSISIDEDINSRKPQVHIVAIGGISVALKKALEKMPGPEGHLRLARTLLSFGSRE